MHQQITLSGKHVLIVLAHPDDEIICGWPIFQMSDVKKSILIASSDRFNPERTWCAHRKFVFQDVCKAFTINGFCLDFNSGFYKLPHRTGALCDFYSEILRHIEIFRPFDYVFCHNPLGEYGHHDHKLIFNIVSNYVEEPIIITDIVMSSDWSPIDSLSQRTLSLYYRQMITEVRRSSEVFNSVENMYRRHKVWTWNQQPSDSCGLFLI